MIVINCPRCGHVFGTPTDGGGITTCPVCGQTLRLRPTPAAGVRRRSLRRRLADPRAALLALVLAIGGVVGWLAYRNGAGPPPDAGSDAALSRGVVQEMPPGFVINTLYDFQEQMARRRVPGADMSPDALFAAASPAVVRVMVQDVAGRRIGQGSGFLASSNGWVVTNYHVIDSASQAVVVTSDYMEYPVRGVAAVDRRGDLALLKIEASGLPCLLLSPGLTPQVGRKVYAIGSPRGLVNTLSEGLISGHRSQNGVRVLQTTAAMSHGSSGGPLLTPDGWVVGVNAHIRAGGQNLNFAVPAGRVRELFRNQGEIIALKHLHGRREARSVLARLEQVWADMDKGLWGEARSSLERLGEAHPDNPHVWSAWGHLYRKTGLYKPAVEALEAAIRLKGDYAAAHYSLGATYLDQVKLAEILREPQRVQELRENARRAFIKAAEFGRSSPAGISARQALQRYWPGQFPRVGGAVPDRISPPDAE